VTDKDVAKALAQLGFTFAEADAAWQYAHNWIQQLNEDELRGKPLDVFQDAMKYVGDPNAPVPKCLHCLDAAPYMWDDMLGRWRVEPNALKAANRILLSASTASGNPNALKAANRVLMSASTALENSMSLASRGAAEPKTTTAELVLSSASIFAPAELALSSASATTEAPPVVREQASDVVMTGTLEPGKSTVVPQDQDMEVLREETNAMDHT